MTAPNPNEMPINRLFSMRMTQIAKLSDLSQRIGKDQSAIVREAIDEYYERHDETPVSTKSQPHHPDCQCNKCIYDVLHGSEY